MARDLRTRTNVLIKLTSKPGLVFEQDLVNEVASLSTINRELPDSRHFPVLLEHGRLRDARVYLTTSFFDEWPLATTIGPERIPGRTVTHLRTAIEIGKALIELHRPEDLACRSQSDEHPLPVGRRQPVIRIVDFESSYEVARHGEGVFHNPPTTTGYTAPELSRQAPDARSDVFSLGAVLYTMLAGHHWAWTSDVARSVEADSGHRGRSSGRFCSPPSMRIPTGASRRLTNCVRRGRYLEDIWPGRS